MGDCPSRTENGPTQTMSHNNHPDTHDVPTPDNGRDARGRFGVGNPGGPGNPFARKVAALRKAMLDMISEKDLEEIVVLLKHKAQSGNLTAIVGSTMSDAPGYFGAGARMNGQGTYPFVNSPARLNVITTAMTVAFWVRPDRDYVSGGVWNWSFGRQDTWRLGFYGSGVKFEVFPPSGASHSTQMVYPLYAGRWYHLAASMKTWSTRTNLSLFVNGQLLAWKNETSYTVKTGSALLYLGWDQATAGATFKGIVDEFRLYKRALSQNSTRGLLWFTGGSNTLVTPRGVFYESKMYQGLNGSYDSKSPLAGAVVNGNDNTLASNLNSRVIQLVITKNVTLADAWRILDLARTNKSGNVTSFPFFATAEFHTLGFAWEVSKLVANTSLDNGGNFSAPAPPLQVLQPVWETIAGWAELAWMTVATGWVVFVAAR